MFKKLKNQFMQTGFLTTIWLLGILTLTSKDSIVTFSTFWHILGIAIIAAGIFGVLYPYVWNYGTWAAPVNIVVTTLANFGGGFSAVYLFSPDMFQLIFPFWWAMLLLNLFLHILAFYFYKNHQNKKIVAELNHLTN